MEHLPTISFLLVVLLIFIVCFFSFGVRALREDFSKLEKAGVILYSVTMPRYLKWIITGFVFSVPISFAIGCLVGVSIK